MDNDDIFNNLDNIQNYIKLIFKNTNHNEQKYIIKNSDTFLNLISQIFINFNEKNFWKNLNKLDNKNDQKSYNIIIFFILLSITTEIKDFFEQKTIKNIKNIHPKVKKLAYFSQITYYKKNIEVNNYTYLKKYSNDYFIIWKSKKEYIISVRGVFSENELIRSLFGYVTSDNRIYKNFDLIVNNIKSFIEKKKKSKKKIYLIGHSMGGSICINIMLNKYYSDLVYECHVFNPNYHIFKYLNKKTYNPQNLFVHIIEGDIASLLYYINFNDKLKKKYKNIFKKFSEKYDLNYNQISSIFNTYPLGNLIIYKIDKDDLEKYNNRHSIHMFSRIEFNKNKTPILRRITNEYIKEFNKIPKLLTWRFF